MGIETIQKEIIESVESEALDRLKEAQKTAEEVIEEAKSKAEEEERNAKQQTESFIRQLEKITGLSAKFEVKKLHLTSKKEIINKIFSAAEKKIRSLDDKTTEKLTRILLKDALRQIDAKYIICNEKCSRWIPKEFKVKIQDMLGGIIAENKDRTLRVDNSFETLLEDIRKESLQKISKKVF